MFGNVIAVVFQNIFHAEIYQNIFFIFKKLILISTHQNNHIYIYIYAIYIL